MNIMNTRPLRWMFCVLSGLAVGGFPTWSHTAEVREYMLWEGMGHWATAAALPDGAGFLVAGVAIEPPSAGEEPGSAPRGNGLAARIDHEGKVCWLRSYGGDGMDSFAAVAPASDGGACLAGASGHLSEARDAWVVRVGAGGEPRWQRRIGAEGDDFATGVIALDDGGCLVALTQEVRGVPEIRLHRLTANGKDHSSRARGVWPDGVPGALHRLTPVGTASGGLREGGYLLEGTQFDTRGQSRPFVLAVSPNLVPAVPRVLDSHGSATRVLPKGGVYSATWSGTDPQDRPTAYGARLTSDGGQRMSLATGSVLAASLAEWGEQGVVVALNFDGEDEPRTLSIASFAEKSEPLKQFRDKRAFALASSASVLFVAGVTAPDTPGSVGRPWLALLDDGKAEAIAARGMDSRKLSSVESNVQGETELVLSDGGRLFSGMRERVGSAWPHAYLRSVDARGQVGFELNLPHPQAVVTTMQELHSTPGYLLGLSVPALPGPASQRLLAVSAEGELILNTPCAEGEGRFLELSDNGKGQLSANGELSSPARPRPFFCKAHL